MHASLAGVLPGRQFGLTLDARIDDLRPVPLAYGYGSGATRQACAFKRDKLLVFVVVRD